MVIFWLCLLIGIPVFCVLIYSLIKHRKAGGVLEIGLAIIPLLILVALIMPAINLLLTA